MIKPNFMVNPKSDSEIMYTVGILLSLHLAIILIVGLSILIN